MQIHVTEDEIQSSFSNAFNNPFSCALRRETGEQRLLFGGSTAIQVGNHQCVVSLSDDVSDQWLRYKAGGTLDPVEFEFEFPAAPAAHNGGTLAATRQGVTS